MNRKLCSWCTIEISFRTSCILIIDYIQRLKYPVLNKSPKVAAYSLCQTYSDKICIYITVIKHFFFRIAYRAWQCKINPAVSFRNKWDIRNRHRHKSSESYLFPSIILIFRHLRNFIIRKVCQNSFFKVNFTFVINYSDSYGCNGFCSRIKIMNSFCVSKAVSQFFIFIYFNSMNIPLIIGNILNKSLKIHLFPFLFRQTKLSLFRSSLKLLCNQVWHTIRFRRYSVCSLDHTFHL